MATDPDDDVLLAQYRILKHALTWDVEAVSKRTIHVDEIDPAMPISGHNGEWLGMYE